MGYEEDWASVTSHPLWADLSPAVKAKKVREFAREYVKPAGKEALRSFISKHIVGAPAPTSARTRDHLLPALAEDVTAMPGRVADFGKGAVRTLVDEGPSGIVRRTLDVPAKMAADAVYDNLIAKPLHKPTAAQVDKAHPIMPHGRMMPATPHEDRSLAENIGGFAGGFLDPINVALPINMFAKAAPVAKAGINLLPKTATPAQSILGQSLKGAVGAGATNALLGAGTSAASQLLDERSLTEQGTLDTPFGPVTAPKVVIDSLLAGSIGTALGGGAAGLLAHASSQAAKRGARAAQMDAASGLAPRVTDPTVTTQTLDSLTAARALADDIAADAPGGSAGHDAAAILERHKPTPQSVLGPAALPKPSQIQTPGIPGHNPTRGLYEPAGTRPGSDISGDQLKALHGALSDLEDKIAKATYQLGQAKQPATRKRLASIIDRLKAEGAQIQSRIREVSAPTQAERRIPESAPVNPVASTLYPVIQEMDQSLGVVLRLAPRRGQLSPQEAETLAAAQSSLQRVQTENPQAAEIYSHLDRNPGDGSAYSLDQFARDIAKAPEHLVREVEHGVPAVAPGHVRLYRGAHRDDIATGNDRARFFSDTYATAKKYADDLGPDGAVSYVDIPRQEVAPFIRGGDVGLTGISFEVPHNLARNAKPFAAPTPAPVGGGSVLGRLLSDESGSATIEGATGIAHLEAATKAAKWANDHVVALAEKLAKARKNKSAEGIEGRMALARELVNALEASGRARLEGTKGRLYANGIDPEVLLGHAEVLGARLAREGIKKAEWAAEAVQEFGEAIRPHLDAIWEKGIEIGRAIAQRFKDDTAEPLARYKQANQEGIALDKHLAEVKQKMAAAKGDKSPGADERWSALLSEYDRITAAKADAHARLVQAGADMQAAGWGRRSTHALDPERVGVEPVRLDDEAMINGDVRQVTARPTEDMAGTSYTKGGTTQRTARDIAAERQAVEESRLLDEAGGHTLTNKPLPSRNGVSGSVLRRLASEESGQASIPSMDDARAAANSAIDAGINAADVAARIARPVDSLIEQAIGATRIGTPVHLAAGFVRRGKDAAKERLRTGLTGGANEHVDSLGRGFVSSKAPAQYQDLKDRIRSQTIRQMQGLTDEAARLDEAGVDQEALYNIVTDRALSSADAEAVRAKTNQVSRDLLEVGNLTPEQQAKWDNEYLPRTYLDKDNAVGQLARKARRAITLSGAKRRGKVDMISAETFALRKRPWREAGEAADGRVVLEDPTNGQTMLVSRRKVGDFTADWSNLGTAKGGKVKAWRDWTDSEMEAMGIHKDVSHALRKLASQAYRDLNNGRLLKAVSENPEWAVRDAAGVTPPEGWVYFGKDVVKSNGVHKWGRLADHWVEPSVAHDLAAATDNDAIGGIVKFLRTFTGINQFKKLKVVYNPASHGNQLMQNMITLEAAGGSVSDVPRAARMLREADNPTITRLRELGLYGDDYLSTEGMSGAGSNDYLDWGAMAGIPRVGATIDQAASSLYQFSDNMTRTAYVLGKLDEGVPVEQAVKEARERFYNGNTVNSAFARLGSASLLPFVKPVLYTFDRLPELIEANPAKAVKLLAYWFAFDQGFKAISGHAGDEDGRQALLPDYQKGIAKTIPLPITDTRGQQLLFDYQRMNPVGSAFGVNDRTGFGPVPEAFVPTGGPLGAVGQAIANRDLFRDEPLRTATENNTAAFLMSQFLPGFTANAQRLDRARRGLPEYTGGPQYDIPTAAAGMLGIKVQPFNPEQGYEKNARAFEAERMALEAMARTVASNLEGGFISEEEHDRQMADIERRMEDLQARFEAWDERAQRGLEAFRGRGQ